MDLRLSFALLLWLALLGIALFPALTKAEFTASKWWKTLASFCLLLAVALPVWRLRSLLYNGEVNVDESQVLAQAMRYRIDPIPWRGVDGGSSGPLNTWIILWAPLLGLKMDYFAARITGLTCLWAMLCGLTLTLSELVNRRLAMLLALPAITLLLTILNFDYLFFSSEQLPIAIMAWVVYALTLLAKNPSRWIVYVIGFLTGALPFCKIQVGPAGVYLWVIAAAIVIYQRKTIREAASLLIPLILGGLSVPLLILGPVIAAGAWNDFIDLYIKSGLVYKNSPAGTGQTPSNLEIFSQLITGIPEFFAFVMAALCSGLALLAWATPHVYKSTRTTHLVLAAIAGFALLLAYSIYRTGFGFPHYTHLLILPFALLTAAMGLLLPKTHTLLRPPTPLVVALIALPILFQGQCALKEIASHRPLLADWGPGVHPIADILKKYATPTDTMFVWGYAPKYHAFSGIPPASRFLQSVGFLGLTPEVQAEPRGNFQRLLADLHQYQPTLFVDAPDEFWFPSLNVPRGNLARHTTVKPVAQFISDNYQLILQINMDPQKVPILIYKRKPEL